MSENVKENVVETNEENVTEEAVNTTEFVEPSGKGRKIVKTVLKVVAAVATVVGSFLLGRTSVGKGDSGTEESSEETKEE